MITNVIVLQDMPGLTMTGNVSNVIDSLETVQNVTIQLQNAHYAVLIQFLILKVEHVDQKFKTVMYLLLRYLTINLDSNEISALTVQLDMFGIQLLGLVSFLDFHSVTQLLMVNVLFVKLDLPQMHKANVN